MTNKKQVHYRDADTGQYVKPEYAEQNPKTTVKETDKIRKVPLAGDIKKKK